jgi:hypothetical protein
MWSRWSVRLGCYVLTAAVIAPAPSASAGSPPRRLLRPPDAKSVARARESAARRLQDPECRRVFSDFHDAHGRTIEEKLEAWALDPAEYVRSLPFVDGFGESRCHAGKVMLAAVVNVPRVFVCPGFAKVQRDEPRFATSLVIHEVLHTLGLGEDPPSSAEITERVQARCH